MYHKNLNYLAGCVIVTDPCTSELHSKQKTDQKSKCVKIVQDKKNNALIIHCVVEESCVMLVTVMLCKSSESRFSNAEENTRGNIPV